MDRREGEGISRGTHCPPCPLSSPFRNVKRRQEWGEVEEAGGGQVTGTGLGLVGRGRKTESGELWRWDQGTWGQEKDRPGPSPRLPEGIRPSNPRPCVLPAR